MKARRITLAGQDYYLVFNGAAMFEVEDRFGSSSKLLEDIGTPGRDGFAALCGGLAILAEQGELARRALGYDKGPILAEATVSTLTIPAELTPLRKALMAAIMAGYGREVESDQDVDLGLLELEQKKRAAEPGAVSATWTRPGAECRRDHGAGPRGAL